MENTDKYHWENWQIFNLQNTLTIFIHEMKFMEKNLKYANMNLN